MFLALFINPSPQFELLEFPNQELPDPEGSHEDEPELIAGNQFDDEPEGSQPDDEPDGSQLEDEDDQEDDDENSVEPSTTPTPRPIPKTASTVEMGYSVTTSWA